MHAYKDGIMPFRLLADITVALHAMFILFVIAGGFLAWRWRRIAWVHIPCAAWGALIELAGWVCPLTPVEVELRRRAGEAGYEGGFIEHYLLPVMYPDDWSLALRLTLAGLVILVNGIAYGVYLRKARILGR